MPFRASLAGATNGLDSLRNRLGLIPEGEMVTDSIFNSVPDLGGRLWRSKLLNSGSYAIPGVDHMAATGPEDITDAHREALAGIIAFFTVPSMGVTPAVAEAHIPDAVAVTAWMQEYRPQPFPGVIARAQTEAGQAIYARDCAACHGSYDASLTAPRLVSFPNWEGDVGTDMRRAELLTDDVADAVNGGLFGQYIAARTVAGYAAPPLTGIWASAPYLHNGSVPTLWHLMRPAERPVWFEVGGHRLDLQRVGIDLAPPVGYVPWSIPAEVDTRAFGLGNEGHEVGFADLTEAEKAALLEYLKLL
jgi:mono/diheme cytochrome c family protein